jgi:hypothetical protein
MSSPSFGVGADGVAIAGEEEIVGTSNDVEVDIDTSVEGVGAAGTSTCLGFHTFFGDHIG